MGDIRLKFRDNRKDIFVENDYWKYVDWWVNEYGDYVDICDIFYFVYRLKWFMYFNFMLDILDGSMMMNEDDDDFSIIIFGSYIVDDIDDSSLYLECVVWWRINNFVWLCLEFCLFIFIYLFFVYWVIKIYIFM